MEFAERHKLFAQIYPDECAEIIEDPLEFHYVKFRGLSPGNSMNSSGEFWHIL